MMCPDADKTVEGAAPGILIFGGTTEGRLAVRVCDAAGRPYWYSTREDLQQIEAVNAIRLTGAMDQAAMESFCCDHGIRLIIDAAHPFASGLHATVAAVSESLDIPVVRMERQYPPRDDSAIWCSDYEDAMVRMEAAGIDKLLALTGVQTISKLKPYWERHECWFRILDREESSQKAKKQGFDAAHLVFYEKESEESLITRLHPQAILTKESGASGGFESKLEAAHKAGIPVYAVCRPAMPAGFETVTGEIGLRKAVERLSPGFFPLRSGFTTGACATAAAKAALMALLGQEVLQAVEICFPDGERLKLPVNGVKSDGNSATATVVKDAGDDPDVTNGISVVATVAYADKKDVLVSPHSTGGSTPAGMAATGSVPSRAEPRSAGVIRFLQGEGVGRVTLPGLGIPIGDPAINPVPRKMICDELSALYDGGLDVTISVPGGRELAQKTFNPKLGIVDGISIIGTSGVVHPFSNEAFVEAIRKEVEVAAAVGADTLIINSGAKSEAFLKSLFPDEPPQAFVHYGNFIGETLRIAAETGFRKVAMGIMIGKAVKLAEGHLDTHSKSVVMNREFLKRLAAEAGCAEAAQAVIDSLILARELWTALPQPDADRFFSAILSRCRTACATAYPPSSGKLEILLLDEDGNVRGS